MDRINGANWVDIGGGKRGFRDQNAAFGITGTVVTAAWLNALQEEISRVIEEAGITLDPANNSQLLAALAHYISGAATPLASIPETIAGLLTDKAVTPAGLAALTATDERAGLVRIATLEEIAAGVLSNAVVTPAGLAAARAGWLPPQIKLISASGTYTPGDGVKQIVVEGVGGGGGGGCSGVIATGQLGFGNGGGGGGYFRKIITEIEESYAVVIGVGGAGATGSDSFGGTGGTTSFGALCSATGGTGGYRNAAGSGVGAGYFALGGEAVGGDINFDGQTGCYGVRLSASSGTGGSGGGSALGGGGGGAGNSSPGRAGTGYGGGGGGALRDNAGASLAGGVGAPGVILITEYYQ